jgi:hypothetical protein
MREVLTEISMAEHAAGRPLLSAVVVRTDTRRPGKGFEAMAKLLRVRGRSSPQTFWNMQPTASGSRCGRSVSHASVSKREQDGVLGHPVRGLWNEDPQVRGGARGGI